MISILASLFWNTLYIDDIYQANPAHSCQSVIITCDVVTGCTESWHFWLMNQRKFTQLLTSFGHVFGGCFTAHLPCCSMLLCSEHIITRVFSSSMMMEFSTWSYVHCCYRFFNCFMFLISFEDDTSRVCLYRYTLSNPIFVSYKAHKPYLQN